MDDPGSQRSSKGKKKENKNALDALKNFKMVREGKLKRSDVYEVCTHIPSFLIRLFNQFSVLA